MSISPRPIQKEDLFKFQWLQGGKLSPDGEYVVYVVSHIVEADDDNDLDADQEYSTLYLLDIVNGAARKMTSGKYKDSSPAWSPDGKTIAFVSDRDETPQIYLLPVDGGEAQQLTEFAQGASNPVWSPDGTMIAFTARKDWGEKKPDRSQDPYVIKRPVWRFDAMGDLELAQTNVHIIDIDSSETTQLTTGETVDGNVQWSPDGQHLLFVRMMHPDSFKSIFPTVHMVDHDGAITDLITHDWGYAGPAYWLPGGERIAFIGRPDDGRPIGTHSDLYVYNIKTDTFDNRTLGMQHNIGGGLEGRAPTIGLRNAPLLISEDGAYAYQQVQRGGNVHIYQYALTGDAEATVTVHGDRTVSLLDRVGDTLLYAVDTINDPHDLYVTVDGQERRLTYLNASLMQQFVLPEWVNLHFKGSDGADVEGWFVKPVTGADHAPTILWIHGGPHSAQGNHFAFDSQVFAGAGYGVLFVNHRASTGYGDDFSTAIKGDWGNLDYHDLMAGVDYAIEQGLADADQLGCCGISGGGNLSSWIIGQTRRFRAAIPQNPVTNWQSFYGVSDIGVWFAVEELGGHPHEIPDVYAKCSPITYAHTCTTPTLMIQCEHDWRCPPEQSEQFYTVLKANGCTTEMLRQPGGSHGGSIYGTLPLRKAHLAHELRWFNQHILGIEPEAKTANADASA
jgi:dipeptidyl aminopeptidase/acylaminoacyl peptidase